MKKLLYLLVVILLACEKDPAIPEQPQVATLLEYILDHDTTILSQRVWALAGNHPSFEREADEMPFRVQFFIPDSAYNFCYFESDSIQYPDSLALYRKLNLSATLDENGLFARFDLKDQPDRNKLARVAFETDDSLYLSDPITLKNLTGSLKTGTVERITVDVSEFGLADFRWTANSSASTNLFWMEDRSGDGFCCVYTNSSNFLFFDLRNVTTNLSPNLFNPRLVQGERYIAHVASIDAQGWTRAYRYIEFTADTIGSQEFE